MGVMSRSMLETFIFRNSTFLNDFSSRWVPQCSRNIKSMDVLYAENFAFVSEDLTC